MYSESLRKRDFVSSSVSGLIVSSGIDTMISINGLLARLFCERIVVCVCVLDSSGLDATDHDCYFS